MLFQNSDADHRSGLAERSQQPRYVRIQHGRTSGKISRQSGTKHAAAKSIVVRLFWELITQPAVIKYLFLLWQLAYTDFIVSEYSGNQHGVV